MFIHASMSKARNLLKGLRAEKYVCVCMCVGVHVCVSVYVLCVCMAIRILTRPLSKFQHCLNNIAGRETEY